MTMRFAEHMLLEAKVHELVAGYRHDLHDRRCALGLVEGPGEMRVQTLSGNGISYTMWKEAQTDETAEKRYPWIIGTPVDMPCECRIVRATPHSHYTPLYIIVHLFNEHVMGVCRYAFYKPSPWTLEQLADWIDSVDPTPRIENSTEKPAVVTSEEAILALC